MGNLDTLQIADHALELAIATYRATNPFPREERFGLTSQMNRASVSVGSNIAEGTGRWTDPQLLHFLEMSCGSVSELEFQARIAIRLDFGNSHQLRELCDFSAEQHRMNLGYANWIRRRR